MYNNFTVEPRVFDAFPGMQLVIAVVDDLDNRTARAGVSKFWREAWQGVAHLGVEDAREHANIAAWRADFAALGVSMKRFPTSIEALLRRALKGGEPFSINPLVDFYNALSLRHVCPAGAFDLAALPAPIALRLTTAEDSFTAFDADSAAAVAPGEIAYASGNAVLTRHFMWRQSKLALVDADSQRIFLVSEIPAAAGSSGAQAMHDAMVSGLQEFFACECRSFVMHTGCTMVSWD